MYMLDVEMGIEIATPKTRTANLPEKLEIACARDNHLITLLRTALAYYAQEYHFYADNHPPSDVLFCSGVALVVEELNKSDPTLVSAYLRLIAGRPPLNTILADNRHVIDPYALLDPASMPRRLAELRNAHPECFDEVIEYTATMLGRAREERRIIPFNLTKQYLLVGDVSMSISDTVTKLRHYLSDEDLTMICNAPQSHSHLDSKSLFELLHGAVEDEENYPGGVRALLQDLQALPMPAAQTWYEIAWDSCTKASRTLIDAFLAQGQAFIAEFGDLGHEWFITWSEEMDIATEAKEFRLAINFCHHSVLKSISLNDRVELLHRVAFRRDNYPVEILLQHIKNIWPNDDFTSDELLALLEFTEFYTGKLVGAELVMDAEVVSRLFQMPSRLHIKYAHYRNWGLSPTQAEGALAIVFPELGLKDCIDLDNDNKKKFDSLIRGENEIYQLCPKDIKNCLDQDIHRYGAKISECIDLAEQLTKTSAVKVNKLIDRLYYQLGQVAFEDKFRRTTASLGTASPLARRLALVYDTSTIMDSEDSLALLNRGNRETDIVLSNAQSFIKKWGKRRSVLAGLLVVGGKIHVQKAIDDKLFELAKNQLGLTSTCFRLERSGKSIVLPAGQFIDLQILIKTLAKWGLFHERDPDLQLSIAGRWPEDVAAIVGSSVILASDRANFYVDNAFSTTHNELTGARIMVYDDGVRWPGPFDIVAAKGRTDMLGRCGLDTEHYQILGTLATHGVYGGIWKRLFDNYRREYQQILARYKLSTTIRQSDWIYNSINDNFDASKEHAAMVNKLSQAWFEAQSKKELGVVGAVRQLIHKVVKTMMADRDKVAHLYPEDFAKLHEPGFVYLAAA